MNKKGALAGLLALGLVAVIIVCHNLCRSFIPAFAVILFRRYILARVMLRKQGGGGKSKVFLISRKVWLRGGFMSIKNSGNLKGVVRPCFGRSRRGPRH